MILAAACTKSSPTRPSDPGASDQVSSIQDAKTGVTLTTPQLVSPVPGQRLKFSEQPITLTVKNGVSTGSTALTYTFQVATDAGFTAIVFSREGVPQGSGQTQQRLDTLPGNKDYYWRARASAGGAAGLYTAWRTFNVGPEVVLQAPSVITPANGGTLNGQALIVASNVARTGPAGALTYRFEISDSQSFSNLAFVANVSEQPNQTSARMDANLTVNGTYYLRVRASDNSNAVTGPYSSVVSFRFVPFDWSAATIVNSPQDLGAWPDAAKITSVEFTNDSFIVDFDRRDGGGRWPDMIPAGFSGPLQYTLGMCVNPNGAHWYCSGVVQFWYGRTLTDSGAPSRVGVEWFYDPLRWGPINYYQPQDGELVGIFVAAGNLRDGGYVTRATCPAVCERSNLALIPWSTGGGQFSSFSNGKIVASKHK
jgi:hypothetical protein